MTRAAPIALAKAVAGAAVLVASVVTGLFGFRGPDSAAAHREGLSGFSPHGDTYREGSYEPLDRFVAGWKSPHEESGPKRYDLFSAPDLFYDAQLRTYDAEPPTLRAGRNPKDVEAGTGSSFPAEPFRLQLVGYVGARGKLRGIFRNVATEETIIAGSGQRIPQLRLFVEEIVLGAATSTMGEGKDGGGNVVTATIRDEQDPESRVSLTNVAQTLVATATAPTQLPADAENRINQPTARVVSGEPLSTVPQVQAPPRSSDLLAPDTVKTTLLRPSVAPTQSAPPDSSPPNA